MGNGPAGRILYFNHDEPKPAGGVRTIYDHVAHLNHNGVPACVVHCSPGFKPQWFAEAVPTLYYQGGLDVTPADVLVIPEDLAILEQLKASPHKKILFCQNHFLIFNFLPPGQTWRSLGITHVLASSEVIADFVQTHLGWPQVPVVHYAIDHRLFKPVEKKRQIAFMPRKCPADAGFIRGLTTALGGAAAQFEWVQLHNLPIDRVAAALAESAIFLSLSYLEGFGLPPVEAMASGCAVVGYHGYGGLEFATPDNGFWCPEGDPLACARTLEKVAEMLIRGDGAVKKVIDAGIQTAARYTSERQEKEVVAFMKRVLAEGTP